MQFIFCTLTILILGSGKRILCLVDFCTASGGISMARVRVSPGHRRSEPSIMGHVLAASVVRDPVRLKLPENPCQCRPARGSLLDCLSLLTQHAVLLIDDYRCRCTRPGPRVDGGVARFATGWYSWAGRLEDQSSRMGGSNSSEQVEKTAGASCTRRGALPCEISG